MASTFKVRENLFRNNASKKKGGGAGGEDDDSDDGTSADPSQVKKKRKRSATSSSTLEKNLGNITTAISAEAAIDPIFHWMKQTLGEVSGIQGRVGGSGGDGDVKHRVD